ncbi:MAG: hypothetical protein ACE5H3_10680, partial [Planctomycetota bacterium]
MPDLGGAHPPDAGSIRIDGEDVEIASPVDAQRTGIAVIYQEFNLVPGLSASENIFLGQERSRAGFVRGRSERQEARAELAALVRRLVVSTGDGLSKADFSAFENSQRKGWDGTVVAGAATPWI